MLRNIIYVICSIIIFFIGIIIYGIIINSGEITLVEALRNHNIEDIKKPSIIVNRKNYTLSLYSDKVLIKEYDVVFGRNSGSNKISKDDFITPIGTYNICKIDTNHVYYKKLYLNYPNSIDAAEAMKRKIITEQEYSEIVKSINNTGCPFDFTKLGGDIGIQGIGEYNLIFKNLPFVFNWTNGSIALSNEGIDELLSVIEIGTTVTIRN